MTHHIKEKEINKFDYYLDMMLSAYLVRHPGDMEKVKNKGLTFPTRNKKYLVWVLAHEEHNMIEIALDENESGASRINQYISIGGDDVTNKQTIHNLFVYLSSYMDLHKEEGTECRIL